MRIIPTHIHSGALGLGLLIIATAAAPLVADPQIFDISWHTIAGGGGDCSGGSLTLSGTIGQADACSGAGTISGGAFSISGGFWALTTSTALPCPADFNGSGTVNGIDLALLLGQWSGVATYAPCPPFRSADINHDCKVNGLDLAQLLGAWGPCP